jgi:hypothetical protein
MPQRHFSYHQTIVEGLPRDGIYFSNLHRRISSVEHALPLGMHCRWEMQKGAIAASELGLVLP